MDDLEEQLKRAVDTCNSLKDQLSQCQSAKTSAEKKMQTGQSKLNKVGLEESNAMGQIFNNSRTNHS